MPAKTKHLYTQATLLQKDQRAFTGESLKQISMPMGGIGAGCICLNGIGGLQDFSIRNNPSLSAVPDGHSSKDSAFALLHIKGESPITRLVEGPYPKEKIYNLGLKAQGLREGGHEGFPRFENCEFRGEYPFGTVTLSDPRIPLGVTITGFNPFIPLDDKNSSIPCVILEYAFHNRSKKPVEYMFTYNLSHLAPVNFPGWPPRNDSRNQVIPRAGVFFYNVAKQNSAEYGSAALVALAERPAIKGVWLRGSWFDSISALWAEASLGKFGRNDSSVDHPAEGRSGGSIMFEGSLKPGASVSHSLAVTWYFPNPTLSVGLKREEASSCNCKSGECGQPPWRPYYVSQWKDARDVALYLRDNYDSLRRRTQAFHDALFSSTLPPYVLDAVSANLGILKSPTVLRQQNGNIWAWEGCFCEAGCCHGTCTHVWNYAQAMPHLFPQLERTLREQELLRSMDDRGHVDFRAAIPDGPTEHTHLRPQTANWAAS